MSGPDHDPNSHGTSVQTVQLVPMGRFFQLQFADIGNGDLKNLKDNVQRLIADHWPGVKVRYVMEQEKDDGLNVKQDGGSVTDSSLSGNLGRTMVGSWDPAERQPTFSTRGDSKKDVEKPADDDTIMTSPPDDIKYPVITSTENVISDETARLRARVEELTMLNRTMRLDLEDRGPGQETFQERLNVAIAERDHFARESQTRLLKIKRLNELIIKNSQSSDELPDDFYLERMFKIRNMAAEIMERFYPDSVLFVPKTAETLAQRLDPYYWKFYDRDLKRDQSPERRRRLIRALIFKELQLMFFRGKRFGVPRDAEKALQLFERTIEGSTKIDLDDAIAWRAKTVTFASKLDVNLEETIKDSALKLKIILEPLVLKEDKNGQPDKGEVKALYQALFELCQSSLSLALHFRSSKTTYEFFAYDENYPVRDCKEERIKMLAYEGKISKPRDNNRLHIFCTLFGSLLKTRTGADGDEESVVLAPADVIVWEPPAR